MTLCASAGPADSHEILCIPSNIAGEFHYLFIWKIKHKNTPKLRIPLTLTEHVRILPTFKNTAIVYRCRGPVEMQLNVFYDKVWHGAKTEILEKKGRFKSNFVTEIPEKFNNSEKH